MNRNIKKRFVIKIDFETDADNYVGYEGKEYLIDDIKRAIGCDNYNIEIKKEEVMASQEDDSISFNEVNGKIVYDEDDFADNVRYEDRWLCYALDNDLSLVSKREEDVKKMKEYLAKRNNFNEFTIVKFKTRVREDSSIALMQFVRQKGGNEYGK